MLGNVGLLLKIDDDDSAELAAMMSRIKKVLEELPLSGLAVEIEPTNGFKVVAVVTSRDFETMDEGERQHLVWKKLIQRLDDYEQTLVEFVHTMAPSEMEPAEDDA